MRYRPDKHRLPPFESDGILLVDKPKEWTSFDVVNFLRSRFNIPKVGHCGTLDPAATGLLVIVFGHFTRLSQKLSGEDKKYDATLLLGTVTDSGDLEGQITATNDTSDVTEEQLRDVIATFVGDQMQTPPMTSAVKVDGKRLYELARKGVEIEREAKPIRITTIDVGRVEIPECDISVHCSKGTYIRTLAEDIGKKVGCGATLKELRRTASGQFLLTEAITLDTLKTWEQPDLAAYLDKVMGEKIAQLVNSVR